MLNNLIKGFKTRQIINENNVSKMLKKWIKSYLKWKLISGIKNKRNWILKANSKYAGFLVFFQYKCLFLCVCSVSHVRTTWGSHYLLWSPLASADSCFSLSSWSRLHHIQFSSKDFLPFVLTKRFTGDILLQPIITIRFCIVIKHGHWVHSF